jgi:hypothetical protein
MWYVLVILAFSANDTQVAPHHVNFGTKAECEAARRAIHESIAKWRPSPALSCVATTARP